jgi:hypothetical protein
MVKQKSETGPKAQQRKKQRLTTTWTKSSKTQEFKKSPSQVQDNHKIRLQEHATTLQQHVMILSCRGVSYGSAIFLWPLCSYIIGSSSYLSSRESKKRSSYLQKRSRQAQKQSSANCRQVELQHDDINMKDSYSEVQWVHMRPTEMQNDTKLNTSWNSWHQLHNSENEHHMNWHPKKLRFQKFSTVKWTAKHPNIFYSASGRPLEVGQLLQPLPTQLASVLSFCCWTASANPCNAQRSQQDCKLTWMLLTRVTSTTTASWEVDARLCSSFLKLSATHAGDTDSTSPQNEPRGS